MQEKSFSSDIYRHLVEVSPVGLVLVRAGKVAFINRTGAALLGMAPDSVVGREFIDFVQPHDQELFLGEKPETGWEEVGFLLADGRAIILGVRVSEIEYEDEPATLVVLHGLGEERPFALESAIRYKTLVEKLADIVFVIDLKGRFIFLNQGFTRATGYPSSEWIGRKFTEIVAPEYVELVCERFRNGPPPGDGVSQYEIEIIGQEGKRIPVEIRVTSLPDAEGNEIGRIGIARDVSERRKFEEELKRKNEELERILNTMGEGVVVLDHRHRMVSLNRKARELFGYDPEEMIGKDYTFWCHPDSLDTLRAKLADRERGKNETYTARFRRKGGGSFHAHVTAVPIFDETGRFQGSIGCLQDITQELELFRRVEELNEFNRRLIELADVWIDVVDSEGKILLWNREAERISGYSREEVEGHAKIWEWLYPDPEYRREVWEAQKRMRLDDAATRRAERTICTKSGERRIISWHGRPLHLSDGRAGWLIVGHDVTEERRREIRLREYAAEIERLSQERNRLFSMAAHELRTPLTVIRGFIDLIQHAGGLSERQLGWLEKAREETDHLGKLVTQLLEVARLDGEGKRLFPRRIRLVPVIERILHELKPILTERGQRIDYEPQEADVEVYADPQAVEGILRNLLANAISYTPPPGGVSLSVTADEKTVRVDVSDEGVGISPDDEVRIFDEFYRTETGKRLKRDGSGIGLSIVKRLVERSGGRVWVDSPGEGKGSTFSFTLPRFRESGTDADTDR